jgi:alkanesulfonate monooxygenase SsuD/methylene tetrahydromethanopterin reductase-like flavin-dependent oxidoreductase (luciferase family)
VFFSPYRSIYKDALAAGFARAGGAKSLATFDVAPAVTVIQGDDVQACLNFVKPMLALYIGGMGARGKNFYNDLACRYGFEEAAKTIQDLYLAGKKEEAAVAVPDQLADEESLDGPAARIRDRLAPWRESGVTTMICGLRQPEVLRTLAEVGG